MKQRLQRLADQVAAQRLVEPVATAVVPEAAPAEPPADAGATPALPAALAEQVGRLRAADPAVRFEAVDSLLRSKVVDVVPHLLPMVNDADPYVRRITVDGLRDYKRPDVVGVLLVALGDADENVRDTAYASLKLVTGQRIAFEAAASKDARARAVQRWQEWWDKNKATFGS
jgi:HEAT repeat protein